MSLVTRMWMSRDCAPTGLKYNVQRAKNNAKRLIPSFIRLLFILFFFILYYLYKFRKFLFYHELHEFHEFWLRVVVNFYEFHE